MKIGRKPGILAASLAALLTAGPAVSAISVPGTPDESVEGLYQSAMGVSPSALLTQMLFEDLDLGPWRSYLLRQLTPEFARDYSFDTAPSIGLLHDHELVMMPEYARLWRFEAPPVMNFSMTKSIRAGRAFELGQQDLFDDWQIPGDSLDQVIFSSGYFQPVGRSSMVGVSAVFAYQSYSSLGLGALDADDFNSPGLNQFTQENAAGAGVRLGVSSELSPVLRIGAHFQSRINMDQFNYYRGVFSEPGDFDVPASAAVGIVVQASSRSTLSFDVQRILYSDVNAFTSALLPDRFLSLLGDGGSPEFTWDDLTVYSVGWQFASSDALTWEVQYSTRQQPSPTSQALYQALSPEFASGSMSFGMTRRTERLGRFNLSASYADSEYFLGANRFGSASDLGNDNFEFEALWIWDF